VSLGGSAVSKCGFLANRFCQVPRREEGRSEDRPSSQSFAVDRYRAAIPTIGWFNVSAPVEPKNSASP